MTNNSTSRFSDRVNNYVKYRPGYPPEVISHLEKECGLSANSKVADVGAGTGIFTKLLLEKGYTVYAVEPNEPMRRAADEQLRNYRGYYPVDGIAWATGLPAKTADLIVCAQAFHWFNTAETKIEFKRILKPGGYVALIWNNRDVEADAFATAYELLLQQQSGDYERVNHQNLAETDFVNFYRDGKYTLIKFHNQQVFDFEELAGRAFSSSYVPAEETEAGQHFKNSLQELFDCYNRHGKVIFRYQTEVYLGKL